MNILHINRSDITGGAAIAAYRLHEGLLAEGIESKLLVSKAQSGSPRVATIARKYRIESQIFRLTKRIGLNCIHVISTFDIPQHQFYKDADILNFHNLHYDYFNYLAIPTLTETKPAVLTLHDMWSFTGHCAYSYDCERWKIGCGKCPYPNIYPGIERDSTKLEWKLKNWVYSRSNLTIVADSTWLAQEARQSMLNRFPIHHIPYGIDTQAYQPLDPEQCRSLLGIPTGKKVLMFGAEGVTDPRKGGDLLILALSSLPTSLKAETVLLTMGYGGEAISEAVGMDHLDLGYIGGDRIKSIAYSAADLFIFPTRADAFGLVLQESITCGTPLVSFKVGGVPDVVRPGITGYLAEPENVTDFCNGIMQLLEDDNLRERMGQQCRAIALKEYPLELQARRYMDLYKQLLA